MTHTPNELMVERIFLITCMSLMVFAHYYLFRYFIDTLREDRKKKHKQ